MSFGSELNIIMNADPSISSMADGGIFYENLPDNFDLTKTWIGYSFRKTLQTDCINNRNIYTTYSISVKIISNDTEELETLSDLMVDYLNSASGTGISEIWFLSDTHSMDLEKGIYMNSLEFQSNYIN